MTAVRVLPDPDALADAAARLLIERAQTAIAAHGRFRLALSGGSTPRALHQRLAADLLRTQIDWVNVEIYFGDERCVPPTDPDSNWRMASETLLDLVPIPRAQLHRMRGELDPAEAAAAYQTELAESLGPTPRLDLILLGMGDNGHTASLFPGLTAVREQTRWAMAEYVAEVGMWRLTLTPVVLNQAREVVFLVAGAGKASMLRQVLEGPYQPDELPAQIVRPVEGEVIWLVDAAAAADLGTPPG